MVKSRATVIIGAVKSTIRTRPHHVLQLQPWKPLRGFQTGSGAEDASTSKTPLSPSQPPVDTAINSLPESGKKSLSALKNERHVQKRRSPHHRGSQHFSLYTRFPNLISPEDVLGLGKLGKFQISKGAWLAQQAVQRRDGGRQALIILATPSFATWLDYDSGFIPRLLQKLTERHNGESVDLCEIDVVCACVDGISTTPQRIALKSEASREGFSFLRGLSAHVIPTAWAEEEPDSSKVPIQASLTFAGGRQTSHFTVPLANTLFKTGKISTLGVSRWKASERTFIRVKDIPDKKNVLINVFSSRMQEPTLRIPTTPLTPARLIVNALGNIVRTVNFGEEGIGPASRELEKMVSEYLVAIGQPQSTIDVWALVIPQKAVLASANQSTSGLMLDMNDVKSHWELFNELGYKYVRYWIGNGATLCRVLSGGGGWGAKQGLLSLDPQTTYSTINEARFDFSDASLEEQQTSALGNIAQEGASIQFFVARKHRENREAVPYSVYNVARMIRKTVVLGAVPSTVDEVPNSNQETRGSKIETLPGHFGCVSESGIYFEDKDLISMSTDEIASTTPNAIPHQTKIDLPFSYVCCDAREVKSETEIPSKGLPRTKPVTTEPVTRFQRGAKVSRAEIKPL